jgi:hypothetical protein
MRFADRPKKDPTFLQWQRDVVALGSVNMVITGSGSALLWSVEKNAASQNLPAARNFALPDRKVVGAF